MNDPIAESYERISAPVDAIQFTGNNDHDVLAFGLGQISTLLDAKDYRDKYAHITNVTGPYLICNLGQWIVKDASGFFSVYTNSEFANLFKRRGNNTNTSISKPAGRFPSTGQNTTDFIGDSAYPID